MRDWSRKIVRASRLGGWLGAGVIAAQVGGCLPDNALRSVLSENIVQTFSLGLQSGTSLLFNLPDTVLNLAVFNILASLGASLTGT